MDSTLRKFLSLLLVLAVAMAPVRFGYAGAEQGDPGKAETSSQVAASQMTMPGCVDAMDSSVGGGCPFMGESNQGGESCAGSDCGVCPGAQSLASEEFFALLVVSPIYTPSQTPRFTDISVAAEFRPPKTLS